MFYYILFFCHEEYLSEKKNNHDKKNFISFIIAVTFTNSTTQVDKNSELYKQSFQKIVCFVGFNR
jgi:hypothetical protein